MFDYDYWGFGSFDAKTNMALEEFLLKQAIKKAQFRFWDFTKDSVILGYAQDTDAIKKRGMDVVRRITGGSHVHVGENVFCYTFAVPRDGSFKHFEDMRNYFATIVAKGLEGIGVENVEVDNKASAILVDKKIIAAHSMIWGVDSALIHGLIHIDPYNLEKIRERVFLADRKIGRNVYSEYNALKNLPIISHMIDNKDVKKLLADSILKNLTKHYEKNYIDADLIKKAFDIVNNKHKKEEWIENRKPPFTEEEIDTVPGEELAGNLKKDLGYCLFLQVKNKDFKNMATTDE